jgi:hypothetical protein
VKLDPVTHKGNAFSFGLETRCDRYRPWAPPLMHFHLGWSGPAEGFVHGGYYAGDGRYRSVSHQQDRRAPRQENRTIWNAKPNHLVSLKAAIVPGQQHK